MEIIKKRIRIDYAPINAAVSVMCKTANSPVTQVYDAVTGEYNPDRTKTPTILLPLVTLTATDGSLPTPYGNTMLADMKWLVNGVDISTLDGWKDKYKIRTDGNYRGAIEIYRNVAVNEKFALVFTANVADNRLGTNIPIKTDAVTLSTIDKSTDNFTLSIGDDDAIQYNPFKDNLHRYNYMVAHSIISASDSAESAAVDENAYRRTIPVNFFRGKNRITEGYTLKLYRVGDGAALTEIDPDDNDNEIISMSLTSITFDLRLTIKENYLLVALWRGNAVAKCGFGTQRLYPKYRIRTTNGTAIQPSDTERYDQVMCDHDGDVVDYSERIVSIIWFTDSAHKTGVEHNEGDTTLFPLSSTGIGTTYADDWLDVYCKTAQKDAFAIALDENKKALADENGNILIFN